MPFIVIMDVLRVGELFVDGIPQGLVRQHTINMSRKCNMEFSTHTHTHTQCETVIQHHYSLQFVVKHQGWQAIEILFNREFLFPDFYGC